MHTDLETYFEQAGSRIVVVHGESVAAIRAIINAFMANKPCHYYRGRPASDKEQLYQMKNELGPARGLPPYPDEDDILAALLNKSAVKQVLILDDYHYIEKSNPQFIEKLAQLSQNDADTADVLAILVSSHTAWVKNNLMAKMQANMAHIAAFVAVGEDSFYRIYEQYGSHSFKSALETYAILGSDPGLWRYFDEKLSIKQNICRNILAPTAYLHTYAEYVLGLKLREVGIYSTILAAIAAGRDTLSDIHAHTDFSRAKISVYLKNLADLGLVEKNTRYEITHHFVHFHFHYLYPHYSDLALLGANDFYNKHIAATFKSYVTPYFKKVCMAWLSDHVPDLEFDINDKTQALDIVGSRADGQIYIAQCNNEKPLMTYDDYEWLIFCAEKAAISPDDIYLFSIGHFDERLTLEAKVKKNIHLVGVSELDAKKPIHR